jgi:hypothetical protein
VLIVTGFGAGLELGLGNAFNLTKLCTASLNFLNDSTISGVNAV